MEGNNVNESHKVLQEIYEDLKTTIPAPKPGMKLEFSNELKFHAKELENNAVLMLARAAARENVLVILKRSGTGITAIIRFVK